MDWSSEEVAAWADTVGFGHCVNVIKFSKITGKLFLDQLEEDEDNFLSDTLGIFNVSDRYKLLTEMKRVKKPTIDDFALYGWGVNKDGELAMHFKRMSSIPAPKVLDIP